MKLRPVLEAFGRSPAAFDLAERLPARGEVLRLGGLHGSSGAVLAAWLAGRFPQRLLTIVAPTPGEAERWLTDLAHLTDEGMALYPQREALGEDEPHYEIAGERAETIEALLQGRLRVLVTTSRATAACVRTTSAVSATSAEVIAAPVPAPALRSWCSSSGRRRPIWAAISCSLRTDGARLAWLPALLPPAPRTPSASVCATRRAENVSVT